MDRRQQAIASLLAVQVLFAFWPIAGKELLPAMGPWMLMAARVIGAAAVLWVIQNLLVKEPVRMRKEWRMLLLLTLLGVTANQTLFLLGLQFTTAVHASLAITTIPVFTYALAVILGRETLGPRRALGIACSMLGAAYLVTQSGIEGGWQTALGDALILLNCVAFAMYLVLSKPLLERYDPLSVTSWTFVLGALLFVPVAVFGGLWPTLTTLSGPLLGWLAFAILGPSVLTYVLNAVALRGVPASTVAVFIYIQPVLTTIFAWHLLGERVGWAIVPAAVLVFFGVALVSRKPRTRTVAIVA